jgi:hypothetical protein
VTKSMAPGDSQAVLAALVRHLREEALIDRPGCNCDERFTVLANAAEHRLAYGWTAEELEQQAESRRIRALLDADEAADRG